MGSIKTSTGLASGIDTAALIKALLVNNQNIVSKLKNRLTGVQATQTGLSQIQAGLLAITTSAQTLSSSSSFRAVHVQNSDPAQLSVTADSTAAPGTQQFQSVQLAATDQSLSRGYADANTALGLTGQIVIGTGGSLSKPTSLDLLNDGVGVRRGSIRITDRSGGSSTVDLSNALTVDDVVNQINNQSAALVHASTRGGKIVLEDTSGGSSANLSVAEVNGGHTAGDLGIVQSVAGSTLTGSDVYQVSSDVLLSTINDGNGLRLRTGAADLSISLADGSNLQISLSGANTVGDVVQKINNDTSNGGKLTAALVNGRIQLTDSTSGAGSLAVASVTGSNAAQVLGLDATASAGVLTSRALTGGLNSVLLRNLHGGQGIATPGQVSLSDRTGATAVVDLSQAESLDQVLTAINTATTAGNVKLQLHAALDANGTGIVVTDTSGSTANNLKIQDVGGGTLAADLKISVDGAVGSVSSASLGLRSVNEATSLSKYSPRGGAVSAGSFQVTNSAGHVAIVTLSSSAQTVGDVIDRINAAGINVTAQLNDTGDGFVLVDNANGSGALSVLGVGGSTASDLRLAGAATTGGDGKQRITSRDVNAVNVTADDTLTTLSTKINSAGNLVKASVVNTGASINPFRLSLSSSTSGTSGRLIIDDGGLGLNVAKQSVGQDAVLRVGSNPATAFLKTSATNTFQNAVTGYHVKLLQTGTQSAVVTGSQDTSAIGSALSSFVKNYNSLASQIDTLTAYDTTTQVRGPLQGDFTAVQIESSITTLVNRVTGASSAPIRSLADVGVVVGAGGKLTFDSTKFQTAIDSHPDDVQKLLADSTTGFGTLLNDTLTNLTDSTKGTLTAEVNANDTTAKSIQDQIDRTNSTLAARQAYLENQFANMEAVLSGLQSQQSALAALSNLAGLTTAKTTV